MADEKFELVSSYQPTGDQPQAIETLVKGVERGDRCQTLLGVTGSGKTFTMANVIAKCNRPTLVLAHNKTLAAQLCTEFRSFFPNNAVEYFVSYYDYYQPEAYIPSTDTYIEKDSAINDEIDRLRHSATAALSERRDVIIVASVSCIYSLGDPIDYRSMVISLRPGMQMERDELCQKLVTLQYERNDVNFVRNKFRVHGDIVDIYLAYMSELAIRVEFFWGRDRPHHGVQPSHRGQTECSQACSHLPGQPLYRQRREEGRSTGKDPRRVRRTGEAVHRRGQADRGAAHCPAHQLRH